MYCSWCIVGFLGNNAHKMLSNHVSFNVVSLRALSERTSPCNSSYNSSQCRKLGPVTARPSILMPRCSATSSSVMVHSPHGWWKGCISGLHRSTNVVITVESIMHCLIRTISWNPLDNNNDIIYGYGSSIV